MSELTLKESVSLAVDEMNKQASELPAEERYFIEAVGEQMEKIASNESLTPEILDAMITVEGAGIEKSASLTEEALKKALKDAVNAGARQGPKAAFMNTLGQGAAGMVLGVGALGALKASKEIKNAKEYGKYRESLNTAYKGNEVLSAMPEKQIRAIGDSIHRFAPTASQDPGLLRNILNNSVHAADGAIDANTIKMLTEIEDRLNKRHQTNPNSISI